ncbi:MAG TPA: hypothetical protein VF288_04865 [Mycobacteriales bacterium]
MAGVGRAGDWGAPGAGRRARTVVSAARRLVIVAAIVAAPLAGAVAATELAPPARVPGTIAGAVVTSRLDIGSDSINVEFPLPAVFHERSHIRIGAKTLGANIRFDYNNADLAGRNGQLDPSKVTTILRDFQDGTASQRAIARVTENYYLGVGLAGFISVLLAEIALGCYVVKRRHDLTTQAPGHVALIDADRRFPRAVGAASVTAAALGLIVPSAITVLAPNSVHVIRPDPALASIGLGSVGISGPGRNLIDTIVPKIKDYFDTESHFYNALSTTFTTQFQQFYGTKDLAPVKGQVRIVFADDFQGQDGPARIVGQAAKMLRANIIVIGGDTTATGTSLETSELAALRDASGKIPILVSRGHHDPDYATFSNMAKAYPDITIADGKIHEIGGVRIVGFNAPDFIPFASTDDDKVLDPAFAGETPEQANARITRAAEKLACAATKPLVAEMHDQSIGTPLAEAQCPDLTVVLTGRQYQPTNPVDRGTTTEYISGSTGGHSAGPLVQLFSKITGPASFQVVTLEAKTLEPIHQQLIAMTPGGKVSITSEQVMPPGRGR